MQSAKTVARLVGPLLVVIGLGVLLNPTLYADAIADAVKSTTLIYLSGVASLLGGLAILNAHRTWTADWRVIITILGWIFVIAGFIRIVLPRQMASVATTIYSGSIAMTIVGVIVFVLGGYLSFEGYRPVRRTP